MARRDSGQGRRGHGTWVRGLRLQLAGGPFPEGCSWLWGCGRVGHWGSGLRMAGCRGGGYGPSRLPLNTPCDSSPLSMKRRPHRTHAPRRMRVSQKHPLPYVLLPLPTAPFSVHLCTGTGGGPPVRRNRSSIPPSLSPASWEAGAILIPNLEAGEGVPGCCGQVTVPSGSRPPLLPPCLMDCGFWGSGFLPPSLSCLPPPPLQ